MLTKTEQLLDLDTGFERTHVVRFIGETSRTRVTIITEDWKEMGRPKQISITIEPGDKLNEGT